MQWEYMIANRMYFKDSYCWSFDGMIGSEQSNSVSFVLNKIGEMGWELVSVDRDEDSTDFYFKRQKPAVAQKYHRV